MWLWIPVQLTTCGQSFATGGDVRYTAYFSRKKYGLQQLWNTVRCINYTWGQINVMLKCSGAQNQIQLLLWKDPIFITLFKKKLTIMCYELFSHFWSHFLARYELLIRKCPAFFLHLTLKNIVLLFLAFPVHAKIDSTTKSIILFTGWCT